MKKAVILGAGESGCGAAVLAAEKGFEVLVSDNGAIAAAYRELLEANKIPYEQGRHSESVLLHADIAIKSPGIPDTVPVVRALRERGVPVVSEIEFAGRYCKGRTICITGSNGKTTTATLTHSILRRAGIDADLCGNVGRSFALSVAQESHDWYVVELSSFQLDGMYDFRADVAVLTNITPDHLDRYDHKLENYASAKFRIIRNQGAAQSFVYCADDPIVRQMLLDSRTPMRRLPFTVAPHPGAAAWLAADGTVRASNGAAAVTFDSGRLHIKGLHNIRNAQAAALAALEAGAAPADIEAALYEFPGVEHRMERVAEIDGVEWINDSKATNVDSVWYALESMQRPTVWIAGGTDKGNDYEPLKGFVREKVRALVCMGVDNRKLIEEFTGVVDDIYDTHSLEEAIDVCRAAARRGDAVLLSPACASFDLFRNYEDRGRRFKLKVTEKR